MPELKRSFQSGRMNKDLDERLVPNGEYRDALNIEIATSEEDDLGAAQTTMGNKLIGSDLPNPSSTDYNSGSWPHLGGNWNETYRNKTVGSIVDEKNDWGYRLIAGPSPQEIKGGVDPTEIPPAFEFQTNLISADYIVRNNSTTEEPVLVDIYSVAVGRFESWPVPTSPDDVVIVPDVRGLREGMELNIYTVDNNGTITNEADWANSPNKNAPKITSIDQITASSWAITLNGKIDFNPTYPNNLVFSAPRVLNFEHDNLITGINIIDDFLFWTDNHSEPKKIHIPKSVLGCRYPFLSVGTNPFSFYHHTNFVTKLPSAINSTFDFWLGDEHDAGIPGGRPVEEKHITVIKESPHLTPVLEMVRNEGNINTYGTVLDNIGTQVFNPFMDDITQDNISDEIWISYGGPSSTTPVPCVGCSSCPPTGTNPPTWSSGCTIDFSVVPFYEAGDIIIFTIPGSSPAKQIRAEILLGPDWNYGSYRIRVISSSGDITSADVGWVSELETIGAMFQYKFPRFATRYKYEDGEYSTYSPFTEVAFLPDRNPMDYLPEKGYNLNMTNNLKSLAIKGFIPHNELLPDDVESVEIVYKESDSSNVYSVIKVERNSEKWKRLSKNINSATGLHWNKVKGYVSIKSEMIQGTIAPNQLLRHWDAVPRKALAQEMTGNRLLYGNYLQNYNLSALDKVNCGSGSNIFGGCEAVEEVETDLFFGISSLTDVGRLQPEEENVEDNWMYGPAKSIKTLRTYQLGIVYRDTYGRETPVFSSVDMTKYLEKDNADRANRFAAAVKNIVPDFAESFKFFVKETANEYYNLPMDRWYNAEDGNIWLSFPSSERSKVSINSDEERFEDTFIILKKEHGNNKFVSDTARYKVLAIENDAPRFIKTVKSPLGVLTGLGSAIFSVGSIAPQSPQGFPTPLYDSIRIHETEFESVGWDSTLIGSDVMNDLKIRIGTDVIKSQWYTIISVFPVTGTSEYEIKVDRDFKGDMVFSTSDTLNIEVVEEEVKYLPEFDGRFFVKIHKDPTLEKRLLSSSGNPTDSYQIISSALCQVIDPNSDWSDAANPNGNYSSGDGWDGWGSVNDSSNPAISNVLPAQNFQTGKHTYVGNGWWGWNPSFTPGASDPISGPDFAISNNHTGDGELFWQGFEAQDSINGSGNASRWFIDGRSGINQMFQQYQLMNHPADYEVDGSGVVIGASGNIDLSIPRVNNATIPSIPNNPTNGQAARGSINGNLLSGQLAVNDPRPWTEEHTSSNFTPQEILDRRFKSPSQGIYDNNNGEKIYIDLSCMGFGGPEQGATSINWNAALGLPYSSNVLGCVDNCNSAWLSDNTMGYIDDVIFINAITTPGTTWRWAEDPDQTIYETQNSNTIISDWYNSGGTLGGWKRVGESSIHFNTQTIGMTSHLVTDHIPALNPVTHFNFSNPYFNSGVSFQTDALSNTQGAIASGIPDDVYGKSSSNTANWNRSQRWTIEAKTLSGNELGSGPAGYLPTNDPRWITGNPANGNTNLAAPGVRHDGMGSGETSSAGMTSTDLTEFNATGVANTGIINAPADYDDTTGVTSGSFTWQVLLPESSLSVYNATGSFSTSNPAIWETEPKKSIDLDIYYEIGQIYATRLNERTCTLHAPVGSEVRIYRPADSPYALLTPGIPTGWLSWLGDVPMFVGSWNELPGGATSPDPTFPNEIQIVDANGVPSIDLSSQTSPYPGDILVFYRADGSTTEAMVWGDWTTMSQATLNVNKLKGITTLDEDIANRYIRPPWFNCYSFGNGVESNRIRDDFNEVIIDKGPKASSTTSKTYKEERRGSGMIFSGIFNSKTGVNNLNQFIEAEGITKDLNPTYGSIQKLHSRDTDLITLCEEKCLRVLANKDALYNADGNFNMIAVPNVLGQAVTYAGNYGISKNPESFVSASFRSYFTDKNKGVVLRLSQDGLTPVSNVGMKDWFTDNLPGAYEIIGSFDERKGNYNVTLYDHSLDTKTGETILALAGNTLTFNENVKGWSSFKSFLQEQGFSLNNNYYTAKNGNIWKHHDSTVNRNTFYNKYAESSITLLFNESPGSVKSFNTLNYEGSQSKITRDVSLTGIPSSLQPGGATYTDFDHYDNWAKNGWYVNKMTTNLQETNNLEFKDKEGKWFAQIKGDATTLDNIDPREFSYQGIDEASDVSVTLKWGCTDGPNSGLMTPNGAGLGINGALNFDPSATNDDGSCIYCVYGCMATDACNQNLLATCDDGSCLDDWGCMDPLATNYDPLATCPDNCIYPPACEDPAPTLKNSGGRIETTCGTYNQSFITFFVDTDQGVPYSWTIKDSNNNTIGSGSGQPSGQQGIVNIQPINPPPAASPGTTQYFIDVTDDNGCSISGHLLATLSSSYLVYGCTNPLAVNYNSNADCDDGSCVVLYGCMDSSATNHDPAASAPCDNVNMGCTTSSTPVCVGPGTAPGDCCVFPTGCTDPKAGNYDPNAVTDDGSCWWPCGPPNISFTQTWEEGNLTARITSASGDGGDDWKIVLIGPTSNNVNGNVTMYQYMLNYRLYGMGSSPDGIQPCNKPANLGGTNADWISEWSSFQTQIPGYGTHQLEWNPTISPIAYNSGWQNETLSGMSYNSSTSSFENTNGTIQIPKWTLEPNATYIIAVYRKRPFASTCFSSGHECWKVYTMNSTFGNGANHYGCMDQTAGSNPDVYGDCANSTPCTGSGCCQGTNGYDATNYDPVANLQSFGFTCTY